MSNTKKDTLAELRQAIGKQIKPSAEQGIGPEPARTPQPAAAHTKHTGETDPRAARVLKGPVTAPTKPELEARSGRGVQFYLEDSDRRMINSLAVWFASQDRRVSDSQVIKAAVRLATAHQNQRFLEICDEVRATDRRRQPKNKALT